MQRLGLWAGIAVVAVLALGGCDHDEQWKRDAEREAETAGRWGLVIGVLSSTALATRSGRRPRPNDDDVPPMKPATPVRLALAIVCRAAGAVSLMWGGILASMFATVLIWPRAFLSYEPRTSPEPGVLFLLSIFVGPFLVIAVLFGVLLSTGAAKRLHPYGNVGWQEAVAALFAASIGGLLLVR